MTVRPWLCFITFICVYINKQRFGSIIIFSWLVHNTHSEVLITNSKLFDSCSCKLFYTKNHLLQFMTAARHNGMSARVSSVYASSLQVADVPTHIYEEIGHGCFWFALEFVQDVTEEGC